MPKAAQQQVILMKEPIFPLGYSDSISTIYPKSRFCTKRHKRRCSQGFSGFFEGFSRNAEKENCKFEHRKCSFVFRNHFLNKLAISVGAFSLTTAREMLGDENQVQYDIFKH